LLRVDTRAPSSATTIPTYLRDATHGRSFRTANMLTLPFKTESWEEDRSRVGCRPTKEAAHAPHFQKDVPRITPAVVGFKLGETASIKAQYLMTCELWRRAGKLCVHAL
jgi:hypothetical protein